MPSLIALWLLLIWLNSPGVSVEVSRLSMLAADEAYEELPPFVLEVSSPGLGTQLVKDLDFVSFKGFEVRHGAGSNSPCGADTANTVCACCSAVAETLSCCLTVTCASRTAFAPQRRPSGLHSAQ